MPVIRIKSCDTCPYCTVTIRMEVDEDENSICL